MGRQNNATIHCCGTNSVVRYDLSSIEDIAIFGKGNGVAKTRLAIAIPDGTYARMAPWLGLPIKHFIDVGAGVVDSDYHGEVGIILFNYANDNFRVYQID